MVIKKGTETAISASLIQKGVSIRPGIMKTIRPEDTVKGKGKNSGNKEKADGNNPHRNDTKYIWDHTS